MPEYKIYTLGKIGHVPDHPMVIECADDYTALVEAWCLLDRHSLEVWEGSRRVALVDPDHEEGLQRAVTASSQI
jgi:hypothetical protein